MSEPSSSASARLWSRATHAQLAERLTAVDCRESFREFVRAAWPLAGTQEALRWGWHLDAMCDHVQAVEAGGIRRLLINVAPGLAKSKIVSVLYPAWAWARTPSRQFLCASYGANLAERDSVYCRQIVESDWYNRHFMGDGAWSGGRVSRWTMKPDQNAKSFWSNTAEGHRMALGVGGTGYRADRIVIDDPLSVTDAHSKAARDEAARWIGQTLTTRFNDQATGGVIMIMQRVYEDDPSAFVLAGGGWEHLCLPSEFDSRRRCITYHVATRPQIRSVDGGTEPTPERVEFWRDPRVLDGALLFPEKFPQAVLDALKAPNELGPAGFACQHQQSPTPAGGGMFKIADWRFWKPDGEAPDHPGSRPRESYLGPAQPLPEMDRVLISVDATFKKTTAGSFVALHVWGAAGARRFLLDRVHERLDFDETVKALLSLIARWPDAREKIVEDKANGSAIINTLTNAHGVSGVIAENPTSGNKEQRASAMLPYHRAGNVYLPDGAPWLADYIGEHAAFPLGKTNDDVDAQSQALRHLESEKTTAEAWAGYSEGA